MTRAELEAGVARAICQAEPWPCICGWPKDAPCGHAIATHGDRARAAIAAIGEAGRLPDPDSGSSITATTELRQRAEAAEACAERLAAALQRFWLQGVHWLNPRNFDKTPDADLVRTILCTQADLVEARAALEAMPEKPA